MAAAGERFNGKKDFLGRHMYSDDDILELIKQIEEKDPLRALKIYKKALKITFDKRAGFEISSALARAFDCGYEDSGYWWRSTKIKV